MKINPLKLALSVVLLVLNLVFLIFLTPNSLGLIFLFIISFAGLLAILSSWLLPKKDSLLIFLFFSSFLTVNYLAGFDLLNTALLISLFVGVRFLVK